MPRFRRSPGSRNARTARTARTARRVGTGAGGEQHNGDVARAAFSADGRFVAFGNHVHVTRAR
ncbi:hypothetical protein ACFYVL_15945 [Streptomyces sp. NPDC004111]|uniref:hypothetical protein n=1 Tax=Streptomyces sp. NPDC004111 TaxID=3364690 RepID=UPI00367466ED